MASKHLKHLKKLHAHIRSERRKLSAKMASGKSMPKNFKALTDLQQAQNAIDRAIKDEKKDAKKPKNGDLHGPKKGGPYDPEADDND
jgi:hypothetical protein